MVDVTDLTPVCGDDGDIAESCEETLTPTLKAYYELCHRYPDGVGAAMVAKDVMLRKTLATNVASTNPKVALYVCKILLVVSEVSSCAAILAVDAELQAAMATACEAAGLPVKIRRSLMLVLSRLRLAGDNGSQPSHVVKAEATSTTGDEPCRPKKSFFGKPAKQFVFSFDHPTEEQRRQMETNCLAVRGVISICFQLNVDHQLRHAKCVLRCREDVDPKTLAAQLLQAGLEVVQLTTRAADGSVRHFDYYADDESLATQRPAADAALPAYLNDDDEEAEGDNGYSVITNREAQQRAVAGGSWFSALKFW